MKKNRLKQLGKTIVVSVILAVLHVTGAMSQDGGNNSGVIGNTNLPEYYYALGEATKLFIFGNYPQAVNLYKQCIRVNPGSAASYYQLARIYMQAGELKLAKSSAKMASMLQPENKWYLQLLADTYQMAQEWDSAIFVYQQHVQLDPENMMLRYRLSSLYEATKQYDEALECLNTIDAGIGVSKETAVSRYRIYKARDRDREALAYLMKAIELSEGEYSLIGMLAEYYREVNQLDSASLYYAKIYPEYKRDPVVTFSYAEFLLEQQQYNLAGKVMVDAMINRDIEDRAKTGYLFSILQDNELLTLAKPVLDTVMNAYYVHVEQDITALSILADMAFRLGNYAKSAGMLKRIIQRDNRNYPAFEQLIFCKNALGQHDSVLFYAAAAIKLFPERSIPYLFAGSAELQQQRYQNSLNWLEEGLKINKQDNLTVEFYSLLAEGYERLGIYDKSTDYFIRALKIDENNLGILNNYAYYLSLRKENLRYARSLSKRTIQREPKNPTYLDTYGWILYNMKKLRQARKYVEKALQNGGGSHAEILLHYGEILYASGSSQIALDTWKRARELQDGSVMEKLQERIMQVERELKQ